MITRKLKSSYDISDSLAYVYDFQESSAFEFLQVMVIEDMIYLIHLRAFEEFVKSSLNLEREFLFIDLEHDPPKVVFCLFSFIYFVYMYILGGKGGIECLYCT